MSPKLIGECVICKDDMFSNQQISTVSCAGRHQFHASCINTWLDRQPRCPLDRARVHVIDFNIPKAILKTALLVIAIALAILSVVCNIPVLGVPVLVLLALDAAEISHFIPPWEN